MRNLTIGEKIYIDDHYKTKKPAEMALGLKISNELVRQYMVIMDYESICRRTKSIPLNSIEKEFITNNFQMTINQVAIHLNKPYGSIKKFVLQNNLPYELATSGRPTTITDKIIRRRNPVVNILIRPPAVYSNPNWQPQSVD